MSGPPLLKMKLRKAELESVVGASFGRVRNVKINYEDLLLAFEFVSSTPPMQNQAFVSLQTGKVYWVSEFNPIEDEEIPDDLDTPGLYLEIPHKNDLDLGRELVLRFVDEHLPAQRNRIADIFHRRGAYGRFKDLLASQGRLEQWYAFEAEATERALREWCRENTIQLSEDDENNRTDRRLQV